jgi:putative hydrolase of the HAD superfamily
MSLVIPSTAEPPKGTPINDRRCHAIELIDVGLPETWMLGDDLEWEMAAPQRLRIYAMWHDG